MASWNFSKLTSIGTLNYICEAVVFQTVRDGPDVMVLHHQSYSVVQKCLELSAAKLVFQLVGNERNQFSV
jgi:hypothetical protein